jgi:hypothetical protein
MTDKLINREAFKGNSVSARWDDYISDSGRLDQKQWNSLRDWVLGHSNRDDHPEGKFYVVLSYATPILIIDRDGNRWINVRKYSVTTSKIQNIIKRIEHIEGV